MIRVFKLTTGEEIIADATLGFSEDFYLMSKPRLVHVSSTPDGKVGIGLIPWLVTLSDDIECQVFTKCIVTHFEPTKGMCDFYLQNTSSIDLTTRF